MQICIVTNAVNWHLAESLDYSQLMYYPRALMPQSTLYRTLGYESQKEAIIHHTTLRPISEIPRGNSAVQQAGNQRGNIEFSEEIFIPITTLNQYQAAVHSEVTIRPTERTAF